MKANLAQREPEILALWEQLDLYEKLRELGKNRPKFILHDGPPYANGAIHLGTTMNKVLKDIVLKSKTLSGFDTPYVPGWDCHGLPIEHKVEKKIGKAGVKVTPSEFRQACRTFATEQVAVQRQDFQRLGVIADWERPYLTMNYAYEANTVRALAKIIANGHLHRGQKPVHWCTACASALAEAEVEYKEKSSSSIDVSFEVVDPAALASAFAVAPFTGVASVPIWTTTPWTLPANQAVALNAELPYVLVQCQLNNSELHLVLAEALADQVLTRYDAQSIKKLATVKGAALVGLTLRHPFLERIVPIVLGEHVSTDGGTGNVHTAPAHGLEDYLLGIEYELPCETPVNSKSCFTEATPVVGGMHVFKANEPIVAHIRELGHLLHEETISHSYPHCWRHKTPLIFRATPQWFISMEQQGLRDQALQAVEQVRWLPQWGRTRIHAMLENRPDWCISRQRTWGIPIAIFIHQQTGELHPNTPKLMEQAAQLIEQNGVDAWFDLPKAQLLGEDAEHYDKVIDTLDVWFDSGVSHTCVLAARPELSVPADLYLEGSDQHRGWFQTSLLSSLAMRGEAPYHTVLTHGYVVDGKGMKMSKSIGNVILPADVIKKTGADILRLWAASADHTGDVSVSDEILKRSADAYRRIRNTARFLLSNLNDFDYVHDAIAPEQLLSLDRWAIDITAQLQQQIIKEYDRYHFQAVYQLIHNFCTVEMGSFYLDVIKDRQYTSHAKGLPRRSAQTAIYHMLQAFVRWLAPILSFTAEEIWQHMSGRAQKSIFLTTWYQDFPAVAFADADRKFWNNLMQVRDEVNKALEAARRAGEIGSALDAEVTLYADNGLIGTLGGLKDELRFILITSGAAVLPEQQRDANATATQKEGLWVTVTPSTHEKCVRCWQRRADVGKDPEHNALCERCIANVIGEGEIREYA